jgi:hypothetical protein
VSYQAIALSSLSLVQHRSTAKILFASSAPPVPGWRYTPTLIVTWRPQAFYTAYLTVVAAKKQIAFPLARHGAILGISAMLAARYGADDPAVVVRFLCVVARPAHGSASP